MLRHLDLCSGIGGFALGLRLAGGFRTVGFAEVDKFCCAVLKKNWPEVPNYGDIRAVDPGVLPAADLWTGGYPCQPFSNAGERKGDRDDRHLWPDIARLIEERRPRWLLFENVAGHITLGLDDVLDDLEALDYATGAAVVPAEAVGAPHRRERVFILAHTEHGGCDGDAGGGQGDGDEAAGADTASAAGDEGQRVEPGAAEGGGRGDLLADAAGEGLQGQPGDAAEGGREVQAGPGAEAYPWGERELVECADSRLRPAGVGVPLLADGVPGRAAAFRALGNAVVPQLIAEFGRVIAAADRQAA